MGQSLIDFAKSYSRTADSDKGGLTHGNRRGKPDFRGTKGPASRRFNNPGAQWPGPISKKWGAVQSVTLNDRQRNKIAVFGDAVTGGAALYDLLDQKYAGKTLKAAIAKWSGGNSSKAYAARISRATGVGLNEVITHEMLRDPAFAVPFAMEMANHEMGGQYPMTADDWAAAHGMFLAGSPEAAATESFGRGGTDVAGLGLMGDGAYAQGPTAMDGGGLGLYGGGQSGGSADPVGGGFGGIPGGYSAPTAPSADLSFGPSATPSLGSGPLSGDFGMGGMQGMGAPAAPANAGYADAGIGARGKVAQALMGQAMAPQAPAMPSAQDLANAPQVSIVSEKDLKAAYPDWAGFDAQAAAPTFDRSYTSQPLGGLPGWSNESSIPGFDSYSHELGPVSTAFGAAPNVSATGLGPVSTADSYGFTGAPSTALSPMTHDVDMSTLNSPTHAPQFGPNVGMGSPPSTLGLATPLGPVTSADSFGFQSDPTASIADVSPAASSALGVASPGAFGPSDMSAAENFGAATGSFGGIGTPSADQAEAQRGMPGLSMAAMSGTPAIGIPSTKASAFAPGLEGFNDAFQGSVKSVGPKYSKAIAMALTTPSLANQMSVVSAAKSYSNMNGKPSKAVKGLRAQQIADYAMANPAVGNALGLSLGQQGTGALGGGLGADPFGRGGPMGGPSGGSGGGFGGPGGQPSGPSISGPSGPSAGRGGGYGGGTSGGQPSGPAGPTGPSGPGAGSGGSSGNPGRSRTGPVGPTGPGAGPGYSGAGNPGNMGSAAAAAASAAASGSLGNGGWGGPTDASRFGGIF